LELVHQDRVAHRILVQSPCADAGLPQDHRQLIFANTHLFFSVADDAPRLAQVRRLLDWLPGEIPAMLCGDFNALAYYRALDMLRVRFVSAYAAANGDEPAHTCPSPLDRGPGLRHSGRRLLLRLAGRLVGHPDMSWCGTVDYIFVDPSIQVRHCRLAFNQPSPANHRLYPSDHFGLTTGLELT
jgi:endonuclease/exonuclease/phosphatase family metal-dependent hydrolase